MNGTSEIVRGIFRIGRFGTGESHTCVVEGGKVIPTCRMFGGTGRALSGGRGRKPMYLIPGGTVEQATCKWCKPVAVPISPAGQDEFDPEVAGMTFEWTD